MWISDFIARVGIDKFAHVGIGGLVCAVLTEVMCAFGIGGWLRLVAVAVAALAVFAVSVYKERRVDAAADWRDVWWAMGGCALYAVAVAFAICMA